MEKVVSPTLTRLPKLLSSPTSTSAKKKDAVSSPQINDSTVAKKSSSTSKKMTHKRADVSPSVTQSRVNLKSRLRKNLMSPDGCQSLEKINKKVMTRPTQRSSSLGSSSTTSSSVTNTNTTNHSSSSKFLSVYPSSPNTAIGRISLLKLSAEKKARRVKFYRNGDKYFKGVSYSIMNAKFRTFDSLLDDLNNVLIDQVSLPKGVRFIFCLEGSEKIKSVEGLQEGKSYVASSDDNYIKLDYETISGVAFFDTTMTKSVINSTPATSGFTSPAFLSNGVSNYSTGVNSAVVTSEGNSTTKSSNALRNEQSTAASKGSINNKQNVILKPSNNFKNAQSTSCGRRCIDVVINTGNPNNAFKTTSTVPSTCSAAAVTSSHGRDVSASVPSSLSCNRITGKTLVTSSSSRRKIPCQNLLESRSRPANRNNINRINGSSSAKRLLRPLFHPTADVTKTKGNNKTANNDIKARSSSLSSQRNHQQDKDDREEVKKKLVQSTREGRDDAKKPEERLQCKKDDPSSLKTTKTTGRLEENKNQQGNARDFPSILDKDSCSSSPSYVTTSASDYSLLFPREVVSQYEIGLIIGDGNFAIVHECMQKETRDHFALKIIDKTKCKGREFMIDNEVSLLKRIHHPNVIQLLQDFDFDNELYLITELVTGGDLFDAIAEANKYSEREASRMMRDLSSALDYLHSISICHRDIKPENLLVSYCETSSSSSSKHQTALDFDNNGQPHHHRSIKSLKLADFGLAVELKVGNKLYDVCGTPNYVAPEILSESGYDHKVDIWAAGVIAYVLLCGFPPFVSPENDQEELFDQILTGTFEFSSPAFDDVSLEAKQLIVQMLQVDSDQRISARQVLDHSWVSGRCFPSRICSSSPSLESGITKLNLRDCHERESPPSYDLMTSSMVGSSFASSNCPSSTASSPSCESNNDSGTGTGSPSTTTTSTQKDKKEASKCLHSNLDSLSDALHGG